MCPMARAGIYVRISEDRGGVGLGVARQEADCRALCARKEWDVVDVYSDNDTSAYSGRPRPEWDRLVSDIRGGAIDAVACWHVDRLTRHPRELEDVIDLADRLGLELATATGEIDLATPTGRMVARILGAAARHESEHKAERQRRQRRQAAEAGRPNGGGTRPFGYESDFVTVRESEAAVIREVAGRALAGESLSSVARHLAERGVTTPMGGQWQPRTLRTMLAAARISGRREHKPRASGAKGTRPLIGEIVADALWPSIISPEHSDQLRAMLSGRTLAAATGRTYLLSGILRCGLCKGRMSGRPRSGVPRYVCPNMPGGKTCGRVATNAARTDDHVRDLVLVALEDPGFVDRLHAIAEVDPEVRRAVVQDERRLEELAVEWADGEISRAEWKTARERIESRLTTNRRRLTRVAAARSLEGMTGSYDELLAEWDRRNDAQRRAVVTATLIKVVVKPADPRRRWDPDRFDPEWRV